MVFMKFLFHKKLSMKLKNMSTLMHKLKTFKTCRQCFLLVDHQHHSVQRDRMREVQSRISDSDLKIRIYNFKDSNALLCHI